ncbi:hypothetical protein [Halobacillus litoralis]|uniref:hypothetical protein n=1 Tax=Halobacillus litoralis TaxID=45668 RepID=UPI001CD64F6B|nr:hypothetical protein [Halobacillus litoralis]MCA1022134.1 hypothetical protein [Halobacillus litoralis]
MKGEKKSVHQQYLLNDYKAPTPEAKERAEDIRLNKEEMKIFMSYSELSGELLVLGLGGCYVGQGEVITRSKKMYPSRNKKGLHQKAMLGSLAFCMEELEDVLNNKVTLPDTISFYTNLKSNGINLATEIDGDSEKRELVDKVQELKRTIIQDFPQMHFEFRELDKDMRRYNPFFAAANNAARRVIDKNK